MNLTNIYDAVTLTAPCTHNAFLTHFNASLMYLIAKYGLSYVIKSKKGYTKPESVYDDVPVYDDYAPAITDNIIYLITGNGERKTDFVMEAENAYKTVWSIKARKKRIYDRGYFDDV